MSCDVSAKIISLQKTPTYSEEIWAWKYALLMNREERIFLHPLCQYHLRIYITLSFNFLFHHSSFRLTLFYFAFQFTFLLFPYFSVNILLLPLLSLTPSSYSLLPQCRTHRQHIISSSVHTVVTVESFNKKGLKMYSRTNLQRQWYVRIVP
jgi:hypothetical protein